MSNDELIEKQQELKEEYDSFNPNHDLYNEEENRRLNDEIYEISKELRSRGVE